MAVATVTFLVLAIVAAIFSSLADGTITDEGSILHFDAAFIAQLAIQWFNTLLLTFVLMRVLYNPVRQFMLNRTERIQSDIESAKKSNQDALDSKAKYEAILKDADRAAEEYRKKKYEQAVEEHDRIIFEAQEQAKHLQIKAEQEIRIQRENAADEVRRQIIEIATMMAARFVEQSVSADRSIHDKYIDEALKKKDWSEQ